MLRATVVTVVLALAAMNAHADTVALLPLDGEKRLEIYGHPVAAEIGRALQASGIEVVVVGAKMDVPDTAQLIVDGTIKADKKSTVTLTLRIREPHTGTTMEPTLSSTTTLTTIDKAAAELSAQLVPAVKTQLAELAKAAAKKKPPPADPGPPAPPAPAAPPAVTGPVAPPLPAIATSVNDASSPLLQLLASGLREEAVAWSRQHAQAAARGAELSMTVMGFDVEPGDVPLARARVRARIVIDGVVTFDRVIRTDSIVGERAIGEHALAARTGREVLAIVNAQLRRLVTGWR